MASIFGSGLSQNGNDVATLCGGAIGDRQLAEPGGAIGSFKTVDSDDLTVLGPAMHNPRAGSRVLHWVIISFLLFCLAGALGFSLHLASRRIYQVDECCNAFSAVNFLNGVARETIGADLFQVIISVLIRGVSRASDLFASLRFLMLEVFWLNILLIAVATGERLFSLRGLFALLGAATLAPFWDYGFEIRHDNFLLTGILVSWCAVRMRPASLQSYFIVGALLVALQVLAFKAFVYTVPISLAILALPPAGRVQPRWKLALAWALGGVVMLLVIRFAYDAVGIWDIYSSSISDAPAATVSIKRFWPTATLIRLLTQTPLVLGLVVAALISVLGSVRRRKAADLGWHGLLPESGLFVVALAAIIINPTPFPYNLVNLVPYAYILAFRYGIKLFDSVCYLPGVKMMGGALLAFTHFVPFWSSTERHLSWTNSRQECLMRRAEDLTHPIKDPVYDAVGLVPTRLTINPWSFLHSSSIASYISGNGTRIRDMLAANPAAVIIPNYRTDWLPEEDHAFIREHYVSLADDFWVLGKVLPHGGGAFEVIHPGRYRISPLETSDLAGTYPEGVADLFCPELSGNFRGTLDGQPLPDVPVELTVGWHRIECEPGCQPVVVWTGPRLDRPHRLNQSDHRRLFYNWY